MHRHIATFLYVQSRRKRTEENSARGMEHRVVGGSELGEVSRGFPKLAMCLVVLLPCKRAARELQA